MLKQIYLILTGESEQKRPRSKKLIELIKKSQLDNDEFKIIISGKSSFLLEVNQTESERLKQYLILKGISEKNIILEEESMDTLGNMYFSCKLISSILSKDFFGKNPEITITLTTEKFHLKRSRELFEKIFRNLLITHSNLKFEYVGANSLGLSSYFWKRQTQVIFSKLMRKEIDSTGISNLISKGSAQSKKIVIDSIILGIILADILRFNLKSFQDFENYLFSLPIYNVKYTSKKELSNGFYAWAILKQKN